MKTPAGQFERQARRNLSRVLCGGTANKDGMTVHTPVTGKNLPPDEEYAEIMRLVSRYGRERARLAKLEVGGPADDYAAQVDRCDVAFRRVAFAVRWATDR